MKKNSSVFARRIIAAALAAVTVTSTASALPVLGDSVCTCYCHINGVSIAGAG